MAWQRRPLPPESERSADTAKACEKALDWLSMREHSARQLYDKLRRYYTDQASAAAVAEMIRRQYLDDQRFAQSRARALYAQHKSRRAIARTLMEKGVDRDLACRVVEELYAEMEEALSAVSPEEDPADPEIAAAAALIGRQYRRKLDQGRPDLVLAALQRRGFSYRSARTALEQVQAEHAGTDE